MCAAGCTSSCDRVCGTFSVCLKKGERKTVFTLARNRAHGQKLYTVIGRWLWELLSPVVADGVKFALANTRAARKSRNALCFLSTVSRCNEPAGKAKITRVTVLLCGHRYRPILFHVIITGRTCRKKYDFAKISAGRSTIVHSSKIISMTKRLMHLGVDKIRGTDIHIVS